MTERKTEPSISVVIPAYNAEQFLPHCLDSVLAQTVLPSEIIVVDDGSSDDTLQIARSYSARYPDLVKVLQHTEGINKGASASRNLGIQQAEGTYIAFLDSDDIWHTDKIALQQKHINAHPEVAVFCCKARFVDAAGLPTDNQGFSVAGRGSQGVQENFFETLLRENPVINSSTIVRKDALIRGGLFSENILSYEDWLMWLKIASFSSFYFEDIVLVSYRIHGGGKLLASRQKRIGAQREVQLISSLYEFLEETQPGNQDVRRKYIPYSIRRVMVRARSLMYSTSELKEVRDALLQSFPEMRSRILRLYRVLSIVPAHIFSAVRVIRRYIVKV